LSPLWAATDGGTLTVKFVNIADREAPVRVCVFVKSDGFPSDAAKAFACRVVVPAESEIVIFENVPYGGVAVSAYQDLNRNQRLDRGFLGIPKEPAGVSKGAKAAPHRPTFKAARFEFGSGIEVISVRLRGSGTASPE
jgi:uncharacterized protein (DUF2141 family)